MKCPVPRFLWYWLPAILWLFAVRVARLILLDGRPPDWMGESDKLMHFIYFGIMAFLFWRALRYERGLAPWTAAFAAFGLIAVYGGLDEIIQRFNPNRSADIRDWFADMAGGALMFVVAAVETFTLRKRSDPVPEPCPET